MKNQNKNGKRCCNNKFSTSDKALNREDIIVLRGFDHKHLKYLENEAKFTALGKHAIYHRWYHNRIMLRASERRRKQRTKDTLKRKRSVKLKRAKERQAPRPPLHAQFGRRGGVGGSRGGVGVGGERLAVGAAARRVLCNQSCFGASESTGPGL
ncbi:hypothetical protein DBV15_04510, partial [Temnothorax longispinosus]